MIGTYDAEGIDVSGNAIAPAGVYSLVVKKVFDTTIDGQPKLTKNGDPMVSVLFEIDDSGPYLGSTVWYNVTFVGKDETGKYKKGAGFALLFLKAIGEPHKGAFEYNTDNWIGKTCRAKLKVSKLNGKVKNDIGYFVDEEKQPIDDEVPF